MCGELRDWHFDPDEHPFVGTVAEDAVFRDWYQKNRAKHVYFLDWVRSMIGLSPMPNTPDLKNTRAEEWTGCNGFHVHAFVDDDGRTPRGGSRT